MSRHLNEYDAGMRHFDKEKYHNPKEHPPNLPQNQPTVLFPYLHLSFILS